ncbi:MAG: SpoIIE family protein phosphatase [bacterium]
MTNKRTTIRQKISWVTSLLIIGTLLSVGLCINYLVRRQLIKEIASKGESLAKNIAANSNEALLTKDDLLIGIYLDNLKEDKSVIYGMILNDKGETIAHTDITIPQKTFFDDLVSLKALHSNELMVQWSKSNKYGKYIDISVPIFSSGTKIGLVRLGFSCGEILKATRYLTIIISLIALGGILLSIIIFDILVKRITKPIKSLTKGAEIIGNGDLNHIIAKESTDEIGQLANTFNEMTSKLKVAQKEIIEKEKMKQELQIAHQIQQSLLPKDSPKVQDFEIESFYKSAKEIGGDYYDFLNLSDKKIGIVIADVSGKGVPGSLGMAITRSIFRTQAELGGTAKEILIRTNDSVYKEIKRGIFVSMFFSIIDIEKKQINCASAGHNPPLLFKQNSSSWVELAGMALGADQGKLFTKIIKEQTIQLEAGDMMVHYTDGVTEAKNRKDDEYGEERLKQIVDSSGTLNVKEFHNKLIHDVELFAQGAEQSDDITLVTVKFKKDVK